MTATRTHSCTACAGTLTRTPAEELWLHSPSPHTRRKLHDALGIYGATLHRERDYTRIPLHGAASPLLDAAAEALSAPEREQVKVAWIIAGTDPVAAAMAAPSLAALRTELEYQWFARLLDEGRLYMHFQPIVSLHEPRVYAHEALARATHEGKELNGGEVIALANKAGLLIPLDARARVTAIDQFAASNLRSKLFINFQPTAIYDPRFCLRTTLAAVERSVLQPSDVVFEVVESEDVDDLVHLSDIVDAYRRHGFAVAMDDFGTGYSTDERLLGLKPDYVKLDKSLCANVATDAAAQDNVDAIVRRAGDVGCRVIAEGIETVAQRDTLRSLGIDFGQGWLFARPSQRPHVCWPD